MSDDIRIDDLAQPRLNEAQRAALAWGETQPVELTTAAVLAAARRAPGCRISGPPDFHERLELLCSEWDDDRPLTAMHRAVLFGYLARYAANRLLIQDTLRRHPQILSERIDRPVIVTGLPRSGTTHLVNLLAADARFHSLPLWESYEPVPLPSESGAAGRHRPALCALRGRLGGHAAGDAAPGRDASDGAGSHSRGTRADGAGFRLVQLRVAEHVAALA